jgi:riboflavin transporter FmnP
MKLNTNKMVKIAVLSALAIVFMLLIRFPLIPSAAHLEYDPADIPVLIGGFMYGPIAGLIITVIVSLIQTLTVSSGSGWIGFAMHVIATGALVLVASSIYKKIHSFKGAIISLIAGSLAMTLVMIPANLFFTPKFGIPYEVVKASLAIAIVPFNLIKSIVNSVLTILLYKPLGRAFKKISL